jgi:hypothetical protein
MIGDENSDDSVSLSTYSQKANANQKPDKTDHLVASQNSYWRFKDPKQMLSGIAWLSSAHVA